MKLCLKLAALCAVFAFHCNGRAQNAPATKGRIPKTNATGRGANAPGAVPIVPAARFVAVRNDASFVLPKIVLQYDAAAGTGYFWNKVRDLGYMQRTVASAPLIYPIGYLREGIRRMTGRELEVQSHNDLSRGIVITTLKGAPAEIRRDPEVLAALRNTGEDSYNNTEAFFIRSEPERLLVVTNTIQGFGPAIVELLESVEYEVLGMGPNWTHVPDYTKRPLVFQLRRAGRAGYYIRGLGGASGQPGGIGTLFVKPLSDPADETVEVSYWRWLTGTRMASQSMPAYPGHAMQEFHRHVVPRMRETRSTAGFLTVTTIGPNDKRPPATAEMDYHLWINDDPPGHPEAGKVYVAYGKDWKPWASGYVAGALDLSVPLVRDVVLEGMKQQAAAHFEKSPDELFVFGTDPEDGSHWGNIGKFMRHKNWYPEYLAQEGVKFGQPYALHGFKGLNQPVEMWDPAAPADTIFGFNNWLLREFDKWIDSLPAAQRVTRSGKNKKQLVRTSLYSYNAHDVPPNFNLDPRIRAMIAGFPAHRGQGKWKNYVTPIDMGQAFRKLVPREPSGDYLILSLAAYYDGHSGVISNQSKRPSTLQRELKERYDAGFRAISAEMDFNFGRLGLDYYVYAKLLWNPHMTAAQADALRDRWLQRAYGSGWTEMRGYYDYMAPETGVINAPYKWGKAIRMIQAADAKIDAAMEPAAQRRLDDLKQFWYFYYLLDTGQGKPESRALREFLWKGQMSYMNAMHMVAGNFFKTSDVRTAAGPEFNTGPAHYSATETEKWWNQILEHWKVTPVTEFSEVVLANGRAGRDVDQRDLVTVRELRGEKPADMYFYYESQAYKASILTIARKPGEEIGFRLNWPGKPKDVGYGIARWDAAAKRWEDIVDIATARKAPVAYTRQGFEMQLIEVKYSAPRAGTYRFDIDYGGGTGSKLTSLAYDPATDAYTGVLPFSYATQPVGYTQSPAYFYIPKGTKSLDFETWGPVSKKTLVLYTGLPGTGLKESRRVDVSEGGTHRIPLNPGEDGSIGLFATDLFHMPQLYSIPAIWAKSPEALLVPRAVAQADGLTVE